MFISFPKDLLVSDDIRKDSLCIQSDIDYQDDV